MRSTEAEVGAEGEVVKVRTAFAARWSWQLAPRHIQCHVTVAAAWREPATIGIAIVAASRHSLTRLELVVTQDFRRSSF